VTAKRERLSVLSAAEQEALYGLPDFDDGQHLTYLSLSKTELAFATSRPGFHAHVSCVLQIGYFKAKHAFFRFDWSMVEDDGAFVLSRYFHGEAFEGREITHHAHDTQRGLLHQLWSTAFRPQLVQQAAQIVRRDVTPGFVAAELIVWINDHKMIRPGYTTLQELIGKARSAERQRLGDLREHALDDHAKVALAQLIARDDTLSELRVGRERILCGVHVSKVKSVDSCRLSYETVAQGIEHSLPWATFMCVAIYLKEAWPDLESPQAGLSHSPCLFPLWDCSIFAFWYGCPHRCHDQ